MFIMEHMKRDSEAAFGGADWVALHKQGELGMGATIYWDIEDDSTSRLFLSGNTNVDAGT